VRCAARCVNAAIEIHGVTVSHTATHSTAVTGDSNAQRSNWQPMCERTLTTMSVAVFGPFSVNKINSSIDEAASEFAVVVL